MTKNTAVFILLGLTGLVACKQTFKQTESGLRYKIAEQGSGPVAATGSTVKLHYAQTLHDTVTTTTFDKMPIYKSLIPGTIFAYDPFEALTAGVREGDSIVVVMRMDSLLKKGKIEKIPPHLKPEDELVTHMRILKIFPFDFRSAGKTDSLLNADKEAERKKVDALQAVLGPQRIDAYLEYHKIKAPATLYGTYLQVIKEGNEEKADTGKTVELLFKMETLKGKLLDTNMDTTFHHTDPLKFVVGSSYMIKPVDETIRLLSKGAHARIYIPALLVNEDTRSRGGQPGGYDDLVFEVIVQNVY